MSNWIVRRVLKQLPKPVCQNVYIALDGTIRPRKNPTTGMYVFDGQIFYRRLKNDKR